MLDFRIILEARNPDRRCFRQYRMEAGTDLFRSWVVEISYGRTKQADLPTALKTAAAVLAFLTASLVLANQILAVWFQR